MDGNARKSKDQRKAELIWAMSLIANQFNDEALQMDWYDWGIETPKDARSMVGEFDNIATDFAKLIRTATDEDVNGYLFVED